MLFLQCCKHRTAEDHLTDNVNLRDRVAIIRANESREHRNEDPNIDFSPQMNNEALIKIEDNCILTSNMPLIHFGMPSPNRSVAGIINSDVQREQQFDTTYFDYFCCK